MFKARVNNTFEFEIRQEEIEKDFDIIKVNSSGAFHIIKNNTSYTAEILKSNHEEKSFIVRVNGNKYTVHLKDKYDTLLKELGMENATASSVKDIKAPMPGLVLDVRAKEGDVIKKGDALVVLQAMKMENILKSPVDAIVKKIHVKKDDAIEKNQILVSFI